MYLTSLLHFSTLALCTAFPTSCKLSHQKPIAGDIGTAAAFDVAEQQLLSKSDQSSSAAPIALRVSEYNTPSTWLSMNGSAPVSAMDTKSSPPAGLNADEIALYDRQIRLWGAQAQERIRSANILLISLRALGTEIAKNLTLAGVCSITIVDDEPVSQDDRLPQYFVRDDDVGKPRAEAAIPRIQELNPRVRITSGGSLTDLLAKDPTYYSLYSCVIACDHDFNVLSHINTTARFGSCPFYAAGIHGFNGFIFADLGTHDYIVEREKSNIATAVGPESITRSVLSVTTKKENSGKTKEFVKKREVYCPLILANSSSLPLEVLSNRRKLKGVPPLLPILRAYFDHQRTIGPQVGHSGQELAVFTSSVATKVRELQLPPDIVTGNFLRSFVHTLGTELIAIAAFIGGRLSEDVINVISKREQPIQNFVFFDGNTFDGKIYSLYSPPPELASLDLNAPILAVPGNITLTNDQAEFGIPASIPVAGIPQMVNGSSSLHPSAIEGQNMGADGQLDQTQ